VEGTHFAAGPWFTVLESGSGWTRLGTIELGNGAATEIVTVEYRVDFAEDSP
jgi:hypothetical protein